MADFSFSVDWGGLLNTGVLFAGIFILVMLRMLVAILRSRPVEMLRSENVGEKPPKANWVLALLGLAALVYAYRLAVTIDDPITAIAVFFGAVIPGDRCDLSPFYLRISNAVQTAPEKEILLL